MDKVLFLFLRRMRAPLLLLMAAYSISITGLVLIPGMDAEGEVWRMDFFHAFYFVTYTAPTIGFGEIPYPFTEAQRMWAALTIYLSVIAWLYAIGRILGLVQDPTFRLAVSQQAFDRSIRRLRAPFFIVCGYGDTGELLVRALLERRKRVVVIDHRQERITELALSDMDYHVPGLCADASSSARLRSAGLNHPFCEGVVALTDSDAANLKIAITVKLLNPEAAGDLPRREPGCGEEHAVLRHRAGHQPLRDLRRPAGAGPAFARASHAAPVADQRSGQRAADAAVPAARPLDPLRLRPLRQGGARGAQARGRDHRDRRGGSRGHRMPR
jgi:hypothetical protein